MPRNQYVTIRESTAATWTSVNPILARGELGYETDTGKFKVGNGTSTWSSLSYGGLSSFQNTSVIQNFGDGSDGNLTLTTANYTGGPITAGVLTRDAYFNNLTISGSGSLNTNSYRLFVAGTLDVSAASTGAINNNGINGFNNLGTGGQQTTTPTNGSVGAGLHGGNSGGGTTANIGTFGTNAALSTNPGNGGSGASGGALAGAGFNTTKATWLTRMSPSGGTAWSTVDNYIYPSGIAAINIANTVDSLGNIYCAGWGQDSTGLQHGIVRKSSNAGVSWTTVDDYNYVAGQVTQIHGIGADLAGNIYSLIWGFTTSSLSHWIVRKSADHGATWTTVDDYLYPSSTNIAQPAGFTVDLLGNIFVCGQARDASNVTRWIVRKSPDNGATWSTVDDYVLSSVSGQTAAAVMMAVDSAGNLYAVGSASQPGPLKSWITRQSTDYGATWTTVDSYLYPGTSASSAASGICKDSLGNMYVTGFGRDDANNAFNYHWITRQSTDNGVTWTTVDDYLSAPASDNSVAMNASSATADALGNIYVVGQSQDIGGYFRWLCRKSSNAGVSWTNVDNFLNGSSTIKNRPMILPGCP